MLKKIVVFCLYLLFSTITLGGKPGSTPLTIGVIYNLTGAQSTLDIFSLNGAKLAVAKANTAGGVLGKQIQLLVLDGKTDPAIIQKDAQQLGDNKNVTAVIGLNDTDMALAAIPTLALHKKLFITSGATSPNLPNAALGWVFLACFSDNQQAEHAASFAYESLDATSALVIAQDDFLYAELLKKYFTKSYEQLGGNILATISYNHQSPDISKQLNELNKKGIQPQIIYVAGGPVMVLNIIRQVRAAHFKQPIMGGDSFDSSALDALKMPDMGTIYFTTHGFINPTNMNPRVQQFIHDYQAAYHTLPDSSFAGLGYDTVNVLLQAIRNANSLETDKIREALLHLQFIGVTGQFDYSGYIPEKTITIIKFQDGQRYLTT